MKVRRPGDDDRGDEQERERRVVAPDLRHDAPDEGAQPPRRSCRHLRRRRRSARNAASRSSVPACARSSAPVPRAITRPARMNSSSSQRSASSMTWLDTTIVAPPSARARKWPQNWTRSSGSTPTVGSSRKSDRRPVDQRAGERQAPPLAARQRAGDGLRPVRRARRARGPRSTAAPVSRAVGRGEEPRVLADRERRVDAVALGHVADPRERLAATASARRGPPRDPRWPASCPVSRRISVVLPEPFGPSRP